MRVNYGRMVDYVPCVECALSKEFELYADNRTHWSFARYCLWKRKVIYEDEDCNVLDHDLEYIAALLHRAEMILSIQL